MPRGLAIAALLLASAASAQTLPNDAGIPPSLREWRPWALKDLDYRACPFFSSARGDAAGEFVCAWPGRLTLATTADAATFSIRWRVEAPSWIALPGEAEHWPQQVAVNGQRQPVLDRGGHPVLRLGAGTFEIGGRIPWRERPQALTVPAAIGLVALTVDGKAVLPVQRDGGQVTLGRAATAAPEADGVTLRVYRKLSDGVPAQLETRIVIAASGQAREEVIGPVLPPGFAPILLRGEWPARLDADGRLRVQVQPGNDIMAVSARATAPLTSVAAHLPPSPWPTQEIWSYEAAPRLRVTVARGAVQIDPRQADVPDEWRELPAFALADGGRLAIEQRSRGLAPDEANRLTLQRETWLDFDGDGWFARDHLLGTMASGWRLDVAAPYALERATALNSRREAGGEPLLITRGAQADWSGVEWRTSHVDLDAGLRLSGRDAPPVAGWQQTFDNVSATLHFPFGYKLLAAPGADSASGSWASAWTLLDAFVCAIVVLLAWRLFGTIAAALAAAFLLLAYQESGVPLWSLVAAQALALAGRALPAGRLQTGVEWARRAVALLLVLVALPFATTQLRAALYPQLESGGYAAYGRPVAFGGGVGHAPPPLRDVPAAATRQLEAEPAAPPAGVRAENYSVLPEQASQSDARAKSNPKDERKADKSAALDRIVVTGSRIDRSSLIDHYAETTLVQTGHGAPSWNLGSTAWLTWSGPVLATQTVRLLIAPPWLVRPLRVVLVVLLAFIVWRLIGAGAGARASRGGLLGTAMLLAGGLAFGPAAQAQSYPSPELLQQLRERLGETPKCAPQCASIAEAQVSANGDSIDIALEAHAGDRVALPLPDDAAAAALQSIQVDGAAGDDVLRSEDGKLWIAVSRGVHRIQLAFAARGDKVALAFPLQPARVLFTGKGWESSGLADDRLQTETLTLTRARDDAGTATDDGTQQFAPYVQVTRMLSVGLEWSAHTRVRRLSPAQGGFTIALPLIGGEHVSTSGVKVQDGKAQVAIADAEDEAYWNSVLDKADTLTLTAPALADHAEVWTVLVSPTWHVEFAGVPMVSAMAGDNADDFRNFEFHPLPGETLTLRITRPAAAQGAQRAIDSVEFNSEAGQRATTRVLTFALRASQGGEQVVTLPKDAEVLAVQRDGSALNLRPLDGRLSLPVLPGAQTYEIRLRSAEPAATLTRTPQIAFGQPAANIRLTLALPHDRWLLAAFGPAAGPAVLYWGELLVMIGAAFALARTRRTRLRFRDWLLLGLGFSTFSWLALLVVVAWLFAFEWRSQAPLPQARWRFNLVQSALVVLTVFALVALVAAIPQGLLGEPDMHVAGFGSSAHALQWFADRSADELPSAYVISAPLWLYKTLMLIWAVWLANALIGWLRAAFAAWTRDGYWRARPAVSAAAAPGEAAADAATP